MEDDMTGDITRAPWDAKTVAALNAWQRAPVHPFTCGDSRHDDPAAHRPVLIAYEDGWHCPDPVCTYRQDWAHDFMADPPPDQWTAIP